MGAFNGSGVFLRSFKWVNDAAANIFIRADRMDEEDDGYATALSNCVTRDGQSPAMADLPMGNFKHTQVDDADSRSNYASAAQIQDDSIIWCGTATGTANAITLTPSIAISGYGTGGMRFAFTAAFANSSAVTLAVSGQLPKAVTRQGAIPLAANNIVAGSIVEVRYDGTQFQITTPASSLFIPNASFATQAQQEAATATDKVVSPGTQQYHPGMPKFWVLFNGNTGAIAASYNVSSVVKNSTGLYTVVFAVPFSGAAYALDGFSQDTGGGNGAACALANIGGARQAAQCTIATFNPSTLIASDSPSVNVFGYGDQ